VGLLGERDMERDMRKRAGKQFSTRLSSSGSNQKQEEDAALAGKKGKSGGLARRPETGQKKSHFFITRNSGRVREMNEQSTTEACCVTRKVGKHTPRPGFMEKTGEGSRSGVRKRRPYQSGSKNLRVARAPGWGLW